MATLWAVNPKKRRRGKKRRSAAQRAATAKMLAANKGARRGRKRRAVAASGPARRTARRTVRRARRGLIAFSRGNVAGMLKAGAIGGAGAVLTDVAMGYTSRVLPAAVASPVAADGSPQYGYFAVKAALAVGLGVYGGRVMPPAVAGRMAEGALTVMAYQFLRPLVPSGVALGYVNPAPLQRPVNAYVSGVRGVGAYQSLPRGTGANVLNMARSGVRRAA